MNRGIARTALLPGALAAALLLSACENPVVVTGVDISPNYQTSELRRYGSGGNELRVEVHGDPFGAGEVATRAAAIAAMQGKNIGNPVTFAAVPGQEAQPPSRVVLYFNPRGLIGGETLCDPRTPITTSPSGGGRVVVSGAWCQSDYVISRANARVDKADGLSSEPFQALMGQLTIALFPPKNPHEETRRGRCWPFCR